MSISLRTTRVKETLIPEWNSDNLSLRLPKSLKIMKPAKFALRFTLLLPILLIPTGAIGGRSHDSDRRRDLEGGWGPIEDPTDDPLAKEMAEFAMFEYNKESAKIGLKFEKVISGESQVVAGLNSRLVILASSGGDGSSRRYEAIVYWRAWEHYKNLTSFRPI